MYDPMGGEEGYLNHLLDDWLASRGFPGCGLPEVQLLQLLGLVDAMDSTHMQRHLPHRQSLLQPHDVRACRMPIISQLASCALHFSLYLPCQDVPQHKDSSPPVTAAFIKLSATQACSGRHPEAIFYRIPSEGRQVNRSPLHRSQQANDDEGRSPMHAAQKSTSHQRVIDLHPQQLGPWM